MTEQTLPCCRDCNCWGTDPELTIKAKRTDPELRNCGARPSGIMLTPEYRGVGCPWHQRTEKEA